MVYCAFSMVYCAFGVGTAALQACNSVYTSATAPFIVQSDNPSLKTHDLATVT